MRARLRIAVLGTGIAAALACVAAACTSLTGLSGGPDASVDAPGTAEAGVGDGAQSPVDAGVDARCEGVDTNANPKNCGRCGHDCLGGTCAAGVCAPVLFAAASTNHADEALSLKDGTLYWTTFLGGTITRGGVVIGTPGGNPSGLMVQGNTLYWAEFSTGRLGQASLDGGSSAIVTDAGLGSPGFLAMDDAGAIVVADMAGGAVRRLDTVGNTVLVGNLSQPWGVAVWKGTLYYTEYGGGRVWRKDLGGSSSPMPLASAETKPGGIVADDNDVYWTNVNAPDAGSQGVRRWRAGSVDTLVPGPVELGITADDVSIYYAPTPGDRVMRLAK